MQKYTVKVSDDGTKDWYIEGKEYTEAEFIIRTTLCGEYRIFFNNSKFTLLNISTQEKTKFSKLDKLLEHIEADITKCF